MRRVYMDANATTPLAPEVFEAMRPFYGERFGNASSIHMEGQQARAAVDHARESVATLIGARSSEIVFTSGGTESDNLALFGSLKTGDHLVTSAIEHSAVLHAAQELAKRGVEVTYVGCDGASRVLPEAVQAAMRPHTKLVSIMLANNETGVLQPAAEFAAIAHAHGALFHTDAVQAAGKAPVSVTALECDLLSVSAHKIHGPQGVGALYVRRNVRVSPLFYGGTHERQRRAGTENVPGIVGFGKAAEMAYAWMADGGAERLAAERDRLEAGILAAVAECGMNGALAEGRATRVCNTTNLYFDHVEAEALLIALDLKGLAVSGGSACQSGATEPSHVLVAMGLSPARARASLRFSLSKLTTKADVEFALEIVPTAVARLRELSPSFTGAL
jgi:cysteine desulfurase